MKSLHRPDCFAWSEFDEARNIDFNSFVLVREGGNLLIDPLPLTPHDRAHLEALGGAATIVVTNSDHIRAAAALAEELSAKVIGPRAESETFSIKCDGWVGEGDEAAPGVMVFEMAGSKTPGELALLVDGTTLITGDLVRAHRGGALMILPDPKLTDRLKAVESVTRLAEIESVEAVLVGDGWPVFRGGHERLQMLAHDLGVGGQGD